MAVAQTEVKIPGIDWASMLRGVILVFPLVLVLGLWSATILVMGVMCLKPLTKVRTQVIGPPMMNQGLLDERSRSFTVFLGVLVFSVAAWAGLVEVVSDHQQRAAVIFLVVLLLLMWFRPSMAVVPVLCIAAVAGSGMLLVAVPLVIMLGRRDQRCRLKIRRSVRRTAMTLLYALGGLLITLLFANTSAGSAAGSDAASGEPPASPTGEGSVFDKVSRWLLQRDAVDMSTPSRLVQVPGGATSATPPDSTNWQLWLALAIGAVLLLAAVFWLRRRHQRRGNDLGDPNAALTLARLEAIGAAIGRRRASNEGALTFASKLAALTGDTRLDKAGPLVSGDIYATNAVEPEAVAAQLGMVESDPPPPPPVPGAMERLTGWVRGLPISRRGVGLSATGLIALGALAWFAAPSLGDLRQPSGRELAYVEEADAPDTWHRLMGASSDDLIGWETCTSDYGEDQLGRVTAGLLHRTDPLGAELQTFRGDDDLIFGTLRVGTDSSTATVSVAGPGPTPSIGNDPWRVSEWPSVVTQPLPSVDAVLSALMVQEPIRTEYVDRNGDSFARYESLPVAWDSVYADDAPISPIWSESDVMWVVDIWTDDAGVPVRIRTLGDGPNGEWSEWRRLPDIRDARLVPPSCAPERPWANQDWIGSESWTPSRTAPLRIDFDDEGNPYDESPWATGEITMEPSGSIDGPVQVLTFGDLTSISPEPERSYSEDDDTYERPAFESSFKLQWATGADVTLIRGDEWPIATRIDADGAAVVSWDDFVPFALYESFITVVAARTFPVLSSDELDELIEPLWEGENQVATSVDGTPGSELTILTQSETTSLVVGRNDRGEIVSIMAWDDWYPWRSFGFEGTPPPSVGDREAQLRRCIAGDIDVDLSGHCPWLE